MPVDSALSAFGRFSSIKPMWFAIWVATSSPDAAGSMEDMGRQKKRERSGEAGTLSRNPRFGAERRVRARFADAGVPGAVFAVTSFPSPLFRPRRT